MAARSTAAATCLSAPGSAAASPSLAPSTALGARNDPRSDVSRHKKKEGDLSVYQDFLELPAAPVLLPPHAYIAAAATSSKKK